MKKSLVADEFHAAVDNLIGIKEFPIPQRLAAKVQEPMHDLLAAHRLVDDHLDIFPVGGISRQVPLQEFGVDQDAGQGVVDFMGHPRGHPAQGGDLFAMHQLRLGRLQFRVDFEDFPQVRKNAHAADLFAPLPDNGGGKVDRAPLHHFY